MSEFIAITLQGQFIVLHGVHNSLHGVNDFRTCIKWNSLHCISLSEDPATHDVLFFLGAMGWGVGISRVVVVVAGPQKYLKAVETLVL